MPETSLCAAACSDHWGDHEYCKKRAWAIAVADTNPNKKITKVQAHRIAKKIEAERDAKCLKNPKKVGFWTIIIPILSQLIWVMLQKAIEWFRTPPAGVVGAGTTVDNVWAAEIRATKNVKL